MIHVLIVDDSPTASLALRQALESDVSIQVVGEARSGAEALRLIRRFTPDMVTMDVNLQGEDGIDVTATIMATSPRPILVVTGVFPSDPTLSYRAVEAGALEVTAKICGPHMPQYARERDHLVRLVKTLSAVPVVHRYRRASPFAPPEAKGGLAALARPRAWRLGGSPDLVLMGASTGGPATVARILSQLRAPFDLPLVVVQHISSGFAEGFSRWLSAVTGHQTVTVDEPRRILPGRVHLASDGEQMVFASRDRLAPAKASKESHYAPSFDELLSSAARHGVAALSVILTGMGSDGTEGLTALRSLGGTAIAQAPSSCVATGMPTSAIEAGVIDRVLHPEEIASTLAALVS